MIMKKQIYYHCDYLLKQYHHHYHYHYYYVCIYIYIHSTYILFLYVYHIIYSKRGEFDLATVYLI